VAKSKKKKTKAIQPAKSGGEVAENSNESSAETLDDGRFPWVSLLKEPVAFGLALLIVLRPWRDGMTYPYFNVVFVGWVLFMALCFIVNRIRTGEALRFPVPTTLFAAFLLVGYLTSLSGANYDISLRQFLSQVSYFLLFILAANGLRTRLSIGIVLGALAVTSLVNVAWAIIHIDYVLPHVRESISSNPALLQTFFGADRLTPELKNRLEMTRAFGTFLFPNALAGFLVLCIPVMFGYGIACASRFKEISAMIKPALGALNSNFATLLVGGLAGFFMYVYMYGLNAFLQANTMSGINLINGTGRVIFYYGVMPIMFGAVSGYLTHIKGTLGYGRILATLILLLAGTMQCYGLWLTYSRGAILGLVAAVILAAILVVLTLPGIAVLGTARKVWVELAAWTIIVGATLIPAAHALELHDQGFQLPKNDFDFRPKDMSYDISQLKVEGTQVETEQIVSGQSLAFRMTYWGVAMLMVKDHFFTGVGLGNFGTLYGKYQYLDAHDVKTTHNDYLQVLTETGIFGFVLFMVFWIYFLVWGGASILKETSWRERSILLGMYTGIVAMLAHTFFDFDLQNPSLAMPLYLILGCFYARVYIVSNRATKTVNTSGKARLVTVGTLALVLCTSVIGLRQFRYDYGWSNGSPAQRVWNIGNNLSAEAPIKVVEFLLGAQVQKFTPVNGVNPPYQYAPFFNSVIKNDDDLKSLGIVRLSMNTTTGATRELTEGEAITDDCVIFVTQPQKARELAFRYGIAQLQEYDRLDKLYPHGTMVPKLGYRWARLLTLNSPDPTSKLKYADQCLAWAKKRAERSPYDPEAQVEYCGGLWERGKADSTLKQLDYYRQGAEVYKEALKLYPTSHSLVQQYGESMQMIGASFVGAGELAGEGSKTGETLIVEGRIFQQEALDAFKLANRLARYKADVLGLR
jgi:hypothetical protein